MKTIDVNRGTVRILGIIAVALLFAGCAEAGAGNDDEADDPSVETLEDVTADLSSIEELLFSYVEEDSGFHDKQIDLRSESMESGSTTSTPFLVGFGVWDQDGTTPFPEELTYTLDTTPSYVRRLGAIE